MSWDILEGDCVDLMAGLEPGSVDAVVCDPPYGLEFMGKDWDRLDGSADVRQPFRGEVQTPDNPYGRTPVRFGYDQTPHAMQEWHHAWAVEALRVLKPGGHLLAFGGTRTYHRLACALEDAGFEIRDCLVWLYGSGFPKSLNLSGEWSGWGTALKPAHEPIVLARKPLVGTVAGNVLAHSTGALNIDGTRIGRQDGDRTEYGLENGADAGLGYHGLDGRTPYDGSAGRWPANVVLDEHAAALLDAQTGEQRDGVAVRRHNGGSERGMFNFGQAALTEDAGFGGSGGASRFFYVAKASRAERNAGLEGFEERENVGVRYTTMAGDGRPEPAVKPVTRANHHPTVKPVSLMRWLVRLVTPPGGLILDPFAGSGTTGVAAVLEGFNFVGVEREPEYVELARARIGWWLEHGEEALRIVREREARDAERAATLESGQLELGVG